MIATNGHPRIRLPDDRFQPGDIAACFGTGFVSRAISYETFRPFAPRRLKLGPSHVAILCPLNGEMRWFESTSLCERPCLIREEICHGCQCHRPADRIRDYTAAGGRVDVYRFSAIDRLSQGEQDMLCRTLCHFVEGRVSYNWGGALISGTRIIRRLSIFRSRLDDVFCSQLLAAVLQRRHRMNRRNPSEFNPGRLLRTLVHEGTYGFSHTYGPSK